MAAPRETPYGQGAAEAAPSGSVRGAAGSAPSEATLLAGIGQRTSQWLNYAVQFNDVDTDLQAMVEWSVGSGGEAPALYESPERAALSATQSASGVAWLSGDATGAPNWAQLRLDCLRNSRGISKAPEADPELRELRHLTEDRPSAAYAADIAALHPMCSARKASPHSDPAAAPPPHRVVAEGVVPLINGQALLRAHVPSCTRCRDGGECYIHEFAAGLDGGVSLGVTEERLPASPVSGARPQKFRELERAELRKLEEMGAISRCDPGDIDFVSNIFVTPKGHAPQFSAEEAAAAEGPPAQRAHAARTAPARLASDFHAAFQDAYGAGGTQGRETSYRAWQTACDRTMPAASHRPVLDARRLNEGVDDAPFRYNTLMSFLAQVRRGDVFVKLDAKSGFYSLPLREADKRRTGFVTEEEDGSVSHWRFNRLIMGGALSPLLYSIFSSSMMDILRHRLPGLRAISYVDDFVFAFDSKEAARKGLLVLRGLASDVNMAINEKKSSQLAGPLEPTTRVTALGVTIDSELMVAYVPFEKLAPTLTFARAIASLSAVGFPIPWAAIASLAGRLAHFAQIDRELAARIQPIAAYMRGANKSWKYWRRSAADLRKDRHGHILAAVQAVIDRAERGSLFALALWDPSPVTRTLHVMSDASGESNTVSILTSAGTLLIVRLPDCGGVKTAVLEAIAPLLLFWRYGPLLQGATIRHAMDSLAAVFAATNTRSRVPEINDAMAVLASAIGKSGARYAPHWLSRWLNYLADRACILSPDQIRDAFEQAAPPAISVITVRGTPDVFLAEFASTVDPSLRWNAAAWATRHSRH